MIFYEIIGGLVIIALVLIGIRSALKFIDRKQGESK